MRLCLRIASPCAALVLALPLAAGAQEAGGPSQPPAAVRTRPPDDQPNRVAVPRRPTEPVRAAEPAPAAGEKTRVPAANEEPPADAEQRRTAQPRRGSDRGDRQRDGDRGGRDRDRVWGGSRGTTIHARPVYPPFHGSRSWGGPRWYARPYVHHPYWSRGVVWNPLFYAPWGLVWGTAGHWGHLAWGPPPGWWYPGWYPGFGGTTTFDTGGVRLQLRPRDAEVYVDGYYAGRVDDFDGVFQSIRLAPGGHKIEVRMAGFETGYFDVHVQPGRTLTIKEDLRESP